jgi:hypothetical protein
MSRQACSCSRWSLTCNVVLLSDIEGDCVGPGIYQQAGNSSTFEHTHAVGVTRGSACSADFVLSEACCKQGWLMAESMPLSNMQCVHDAVTTCHRRFAGCAALAFWQQHGGVMVTHTVDFVGADSCTCQQWSLDI